MNNHPSSELKLLILEYQAAYVQNISMRLATPVTLRSSYHMNMLKDIWECAKVNDLEVPGAKKWKRIGFTVNYSLFMCIYMLPDLLFLNEYRQKYRNVSSIEQVY